MIMPVRRNWNPDELFHGLQCSPPNHRLYAHVGTNCGLICTQNMTPRIRGKNYRSEIWTLPMTLRRFFKLGADEERHTDGFIRIIELVANGSENALRALSRHSIA